MIMGDLLQQEAEIELTMKKPGGPSLLLVERSLLSTSAFLEANRENLLWGDVETLEKASP